MKEKIYCEALKLKDFDEVLQKFQDTLINTNRGYKFFVDWEKVKNNVDEHKIEINILSSLIGSKNFDSELRNILKKYPETIPVIPILLAIRDKEFEVIKDFLDKDSDIVKHNFNKRVLNDYEIEEFLEFFEKTGLKYFFLNLASKSIYDYATGVEVGMDTNARKNRSGKAMELLIEPIIKQINDENGKIYEILVQKNFDYIEKNFKIKVSDSIKYRKSDFILIRKSDNDVVNIEANFFSGTGSKPQEIVDSYINRQYELKKNNFKFIWITDGYGWKQQKNQLTNGFNNIDYILNLRFSRTGLLKQILCGEI